MIKLIMSSFVLDSLVYVHWRLYIGYHDGVTGPAWAEIFVNAYLYIMVIYFVIDYGFLNRIIKRAKVYWATTISVLWLVIFVGGFATHYSGDLQNYFLWEDYYLHVCIFKHNASDEKYCDNFRRFFISIPLPTPMHHASTHTAK